MQDRVSKVNQAVQTADGREGKYLTFTLTGEEYGIGILKIREIIGMIPITSVPQAPEFVKGGVKILLDIDRVLSTQEIENIEKKGA
jgi:purine-binding chemotaxis protein CheW